MSARDQHAAAGPSAGDVAERIDTIDWACVLHDLDAHGCATIERLLMPAECEALAGLYPIEDLFRSRIVMERHGFGRGEYKYFRYPLPGIVAELRTVFYPPLAPVANRWNEAMGRDVRYPARHTDYIDRCHAAGQRRPTPLLFRYGPGDYNCLHQDLYGEHIFPLQVAILLSEPERDFTGGEFVITEQRPRMQSRPEVVPLRQVRCSDCRRAVPRQPRSPWGATPMASWRTHPRAACIGSIFGMASAPCAPGIVTARHCLPRRGVRSRLDVLPYGEILDSIQGCIECCSKVCVRTNVRLG